MRTSYSSIQTYLQCPQKYKFQEIDKIRAPKSKEAIFGTTIHNALKFMFKSDPLFPTLDEVLGHFREHWPLPDTWNAEAKTDPRKRAWTEDEEQIWKEEGVRMLKKFYEKNAPWNYTIVDLETRFETMITDEKTGEPHVIAGVIDRVDKLFDGTYEIMDYKTGRKMPSQEALNRDLQLSLYGIALQSRWPHLTADDIKLSLYFLKHGEKLSAKPTQESQEKTKKHVIATIRDIQERMRAKKPFEPMPSALCNWCGYRPLCPAWRHLYRKESTPYPSQQQIDKIIQEYFELKKNEQENEKRLAELQNQIKKYMEQEGLTRVFGDEGVISQKTIQRFLYDMEKVEAILSPLGKWEEVLKADEAKLKKLLKELPSEVREAVENERKVVKEYTTLTAKKQG